MRIRTIGDYRRALEELKQTGPQPDATRRRELEAAVALDAQEHNNARVRRGRPATDRTVQGRDFPED